MLRRVKFKSLLVAACVYLSTFNVNAATIYELWNVDNNGNTQYINSAWQSLDTGENFSYWGIRENGDIQGGSSGLISTDFTTSSIKQVIARDQNNAWVITDNNELWNVDNNGNTQYINSAWQSLDTGENFSYWGIRENGDIQGGSSGLISTDFTTSSIKQVIARDQNNAWVITDNNELWNVDNNGNTQYINSAWQSLDTGENFSYWGIRENGGIQGGSSGLISTDFTTGSIKQVIARDQNNAWVIAEVTTVPVPAAVWLFGSGLLGLIGVSRRKKV